MDEICSKEICTGCKACAIKCPKECISFHEDIMGHIYPIVDNDLCINCKLCQKVCPSLNPLKPSACSNKVLAAWVKDSNWRKTSTSGGIAYLLSRHIVLYGGVYYGVDWDPEVQDVAHFRCDNIKDLNRFQGSKYGHSDVRDTYKEVLKDLRRGQTVLYSGTPCQIAGLRNFLGKPYDNLFTIDLLCHGVPSKRIFRDRIHEIEKETGFKVIRYVSRVKTPDQYRTSSVYSLNNGTVVKESYYKDLFARCFVQNYCLRPSCYKCAYAGPKRIGDVTVADFWGYTPDRLKYRSYQDGTSLLLVNTPKGQKIISDISKFIIKESRILEEALGANHNLIAPQPIPNNYNAFWNRYLSGDPIQKLADEFFPEKTFHLSLKRKITVWIKMFIPNTLFKFLTKIK